MRNFYAIVFGAWVAGAGMGMLGEHFIAKHAAEKGVKEGFAVEVSRLASSSADTSTNDVNIGQVTCTTGPATATGDGSVANTGNASVITYGEITANTSGKYDLGSATHRWTPPIKGNIVDMTDIKASVEASEFQAQFRNLYIEKPKGKECKNLMAPWRGLFVYGKDSGETGCVFEF